MALGSYIRVPTLPPLVYTLPGVKPSTLTPENRNIKKEYSLTCSEERVIKKNWKSETKGDFCEQVKAKIGEVYKRQCFDFGTRDLFRDQISKCSDLCLKAELGAGQNSDDELKTLFIHRQVCQIYVDEKNRSYKGYFGKIISIVDDIFKSLGFKSDKDLIKDAKFVLNKIDYFIANSKASANNKYAKNSGTSIESRESLISALKQQGLEIDENKNGKVLDDIEFSKSSSQYVVIKSEVEGDSGEKRIEEYFLMKDCTNHWYVFSKSNPIGKGSAKIVYKGWDLSLNKQVAIIVNKSESVDKSESLKRVKKEVKISEENSLYGKNNIVQINDLFILKDRKGNKECFLVEDLYNYDLNNFLENIVLSPKDINRIRVSLGTDLIEGLSNLHKEGMVHRDLKPENIFLQDSSGSSGKASFNAYIGDLELSCAHGSKQSYGGTPEYSPPELISKGENEVVIEKESDIWSLGLTLYELFTGGHFFHSERNGARKAARVGNQFNRELYRSNFCNTLTTMTQEDINNKINNDLILKGQDELKALLKQMLSIDPKGRPSIDEVCKHWETIKGLKSDSNDLEIL